MKAVPGWDGYFCDQMGNVYSMKHKLVRLMKHKPGSRGYSKIQLCSPAKKWTTHVHRIVAITWLGPERDGMEVNHKNGIKTDNRLENLEWSTRLENERHAHTYLGKDMRGEKHTSSKLTASEVTEIRRLKAQGWAYSKLSAKYGVGMTQLCRIVHRQKWAHV